MTTTVQDEWRIIGEVWVDSGTIVICDPINAAEAGDRWHDFCVSADLNKRAKENVRALRLTDEHKCPIAVVADCGIGGGCYDVEARYEDLGEWGKRIAEIRIKFLPHPFFETTGSA